MHIFSLLCLRCWQEPAGPFGGLCSAALHSAHHPVQSPETFPDGQNRPGVAHALHWCVVTGPTHTPTALSLNTVRKVLLSSLSWLCCHNISAQSHTELYMNLSTCVFCSLFHLYSTSPCLRPPLPAEGAQQQVRSLYFWVADTIINYDTSCFRS